MTAGDVATRIGAIYREESGRILATLIRVIGDFDLAEDAVQEAFAAALAQWPAEGVPDVPRAWIIRAARNKAVDRLRRKGRLGEILEELGPLPEAAPAESEEGGDPTSIPDDRLRLIFTCCHPSLAMEAQVALTLRTLCGLTTEEIARAFLVPSVTMAQRLVRAKKKIKDARIPYQVPDAELLPERIAAVAQAVYLIFTEGYASTAGDALIRRDLCGEAIRLARLLVELLPCEREVRGLLALLLLHDARREARTDERGELVLLEDQDRSRWDRAQIEEGLALVEQALRGGRPGPYALQAAIAAVHAQAARADRTDWRQIAGLYTILAAIAPTPVVELNRAVAIAMADGPEAGLRLLDLLAARKELDGYHLLPAARADLLRRLGRREEAAQAYAAALALAGNERERRFLARRLAEVGGGGEPPTA
jgi:RNA polymerase sigma-70 factor (ECF subfamily)